MYVKDHMTKNPFSVKTATSISDARELMKQEKIHHLPVVDDKGGVIGIITEKDILCASPSQASTLDMWEISTLLAKLEAGDVMTRKPIFCSPDTPVEEAAKILADNDISGLPVVENGKLSGIITESDFFKVFIDLFSIREHGLRVTALVPDKPGELAELAGAIRDAGGNILALGFIRGDSFGTKLAVIKVTGVSEEELKKVITPFVKEIDDIRQI
ncbi:MAG: hypothetical protein B0D92_01855 [Spirochaeta sp. LUC14_002_19_P3]|nr:MAG: hypothetical protein B0D92_01855 [Spirochaeta sp. LUC14_002_19_P3]